MIQLIRTIHAVGHGGFFTEKFCDTEREEMIFNVVYDCGIRGKVNILKSHITQAFQKNEKIDVLFISHFDSDHVNGLRYLDSNSNLDSKSTKVFIPFNYPEEIYLICSGMGKACNSVMNILKKNDIEPIQVSFNEPDTSRLNSFDPYEEM